MESPFPRPSAASLWAARAVPAQDFAPLCDDVQADVAVVGGGYTGLSAALALAERGERAIVLEASTVGWGASGRNGGVVSAKFRAPFQAIAAAHGIEVARRMHAIAHDSVGTLERMIAEHDIPEAGYARVGQLKCAHTPQALASAVADMEWMRREIGDASVTRLTGEEVAAETGSRDFVGGVLSARAGGLHPLNYARGLARAAHARGIAIHEGSPATELRREAGGIRVATSRGSVRARQVIVATNGYSDLTPATEPLRTRLVPFRSAILATEILSDNLRAAMLPTRRICVETRRMMRWFRMVDGRMVYGGRGAFGRHDTAAAFADLRRAMVRTFPALADTPVSHQWSGLVAMTLDALPHVGRLDDRVTFAMGYNGAGVAMSTHLGRYAAAFALGESPDVGLLGTHAFQPLPFYGLREPVIRLVAGWYQFLDAIGR
ncbi:FAD dependent oxidoreductase [Methylobacterium sp. 4-46]|uniref:NAD(P)/FAD-dependent oxidoreductase n=1 Tax=unclassified Methylobacterium TaxID=2615210 RepID=UPI000152E21F|nr:MULTISPECIES: FAD-binding oxidoreductase [Methylobacterium]ACA19841.1 FAD dependent oxidoreductase [Methylobacterium sp. 4-46]WFT79027.1 FAD-binding oxidoreductase [Methylobacterium nodulans]